MKTDFDKIERDILVTLSDFLPKNQNQIADSIGKTHEKSTNRVHISRALKKLTPYLERVRCKLDESGNMLTLKRDIEIIKQIILKYPLLILDFQKNDTILSMVADTEKDLVIAKARLVNEKYQCKTKNRLHNIKISDDEINTEMEGFKEKLRMSPLFFKACLNTNSMDLNNSFASIMALEVEFPQDDTTFGDLWFGLVIDSIFKIYVFAEYLQGIQNYDALRIIEKDHILHAKIKGREEFIPTLG